MTNLRLWHVYILRPGKIARRVVLGYQCFGMHIWCVYSEGRGTEVWRSCPGRRAGRLRPEKLTGQPRVSSGLKQYHASLPGT